MLAEAAPEIESRMFHKDDYDLICKWWEAKEWPKIPLEDLPRVGILISSKGVPSAVGFIYQTDSTLAIMEWILANPEVSVMERVRALDALVDDLCYVAKNLGYRKIFTMLSHKRLMEKVEAHGFKRTDDNVSHFLKEL